MSGRFVFLSGPSCAGKDPLFKSIARMNGALAKKLRRVVLYNTRDRRPGEINGKTYHFRDYHFMAKVSKKKNFIVFPVGKDTQAINLQDIKKAVSSSSAIGFLEVFHILGKQLTKNKYLQNTPVNTVFLSPLTRQEILDIKALGGLNLFESELFRLMRDRLITRTVLQKGVLPPHDLADIESRASRAFEELKSAVDFQYVIPCHDGEGSPNWGKGKVILGDAKRASQSFMAILEGKTPDYYEKWDASMFTE